VTTVSEKQFIGALIADAVDRLPIAGMSSLRLCSAGGRFRFGVQPLTCETYFTGAQVLLPKNSSIFYVKEEIFEHSSFTFCFAVIKGQKVLLGAFNASMNSFYCGDGERAYLLKVFNSRYPPKSLKRKFIFSYWKR